MGRCYDFHLTSGANASNKGVLERFDRFIPATPEAFPIPGLTCLRARSGANLVGQENKGGPMDTNRLLIIAAAVVLALVLVWYLLPRSTPTAPTANPPPATTPAQPQ